MPSPSENPDVTPDAERREKRRAAGVRSAWIWGGVLIVIALLFVLLYLALDARREKAWSRAMNAALKREDVAECTALLAACRREQPDLAKQPTFAAWESRVLALQQKKAARRAAFESKFSELQSALDSPDWATRDWAQELAELAHLANTEAELACIQDLRLRSEALTRTANFSRAAAVAEKLAAARQELTRLATLRKSADFEAYSARCDALREQLEALKTAVQGNSDLSASFRRLDADFLAECAAGKRAEKTHFEEEKAFRAITSGNRAAEIAQNIQNYLSHYPDDPKCAMLRGVLAELEVAHYPFTENLERELAVLRERETAALRELRYDVAALQGDSCLLPEAEKAGLDKLTEQLKTCSDFPAWLDGYAPLPASVPWGASLNAAVAKAKKTLAPEAETLGVPAGAWHTLQKELWSEALRNVPVFAGLLDRGEYRPANVSRQNSDVWLVEIADGQTKFIRAGALTGRDFADEVGVNSILRTLWVPVGDWQAAQRRREFETRAEKLGAPANALRFPEFWVK